jgi:hypothetical protein
MDEIWLPPEKAKEEKEYWEIDCCKKMPSEDEQREAFELLFRATVISRRSIMKLPSQIERSEECQELLIKLAVIMFGKEPDEWDEYT